MKARCALVQQITLSLLVMFIFSTQVNAGSFRDYILDEGLSGKAQLTLQIPINSKSASCMQCHNGSTAKNIGIKHAESAVTFSSHGSSNHPVGMFYDSYARKNPASFVAPASLDSRIKLEQGQVTCISCHETKSHNTEVALVNELKSTIEKCSSTKKLTTGSSQTRLCMSCHAM